MESVIRRARVIVASRRAAAGIYADESGPILTEGIRNWGFEVVDSVVVPDGEPVSEAISQAISDEVDLVLTSGGTGLTPMDHTPEMTLRHVTRLVPGIAEALRLDARDHGITTGALSRAVAGVAGKTLIINIAGSPGAARDALRVLAPLIPHAVDQIGGGDHARS